MTSSAVRLVLVGCIASLLGLAPVRGDSVDDAVAAQMKRHGIPGVSIAVIDGGVIVKAKGYGFADIEAKASVTPDTLFQAGSVSKPVAAVGVLALVDAGKLTLDENINAVLKSWQLPENEFTATQKVTLRRLLSHSAGVTVHGFRGYEVGAAVPNLVQVLNGEKPSNSAPIRVDVTPGTIDRYSGGGYVIVQQAVMDLTGQAFPEYERQHVLEPFGMNLSTYEQPLPKNRETQTATAYLSRQNKIAGRWHIYPEMAPAGLWTTPSDLARFAIGIQRSLAGAANPVISQKTAQQALTREKGEMGLGFMISGSGATRRFGHGGRNEGFDTELVAYCEKGQGAVVMINTNDNSSAVRLIVDAIADQYHWPDYPHVTFPKAIEDTEPEVTAQLRHIFEQAAGGVFNRDLYTRELADLIEKQMAPDGPARIALASGGALKSVELIGRDNQNGLRQYRYRFTYETSTMIVFCGFNDAGKIAQLGFRPE